MGVFNVDGNGRLSGRPQGFAKMTPLF